MRYVPSPSPSPRLNFFNYVALLAIIIQLPFEYIHSMLTAFGYLNEGSILKGVVKFSLFCILMFKTIHLMFTLTWNRGLKELLLFVLFIIILASITVYSLFQLNSYNVSDSASSFYLQIIFLNLYCFFIGVNYPNVDLFRGKGVILLFFMLYFVIMVITIIHLDFSNFQLNINDISNPGYRSMYLFWADAFAIFSFFLVCSTKSELQRIIIIFCSVLILYALLSRTSLYLYVFASAMYFYSKKHYALLFFIAITSIFSMLIIGDGYSFLESRMFSFIFSGEDSSWNSRSFMLVDGLNDIVNNLFFGKFAGQLINFGELGYYVHNILSYWRQYGVVVFIMLILLLLPLLRVCLNYFICRIYGNSSETELVAITGVFMLLSIFISRSFNYPYIFLAIGLYHGYKMRQLRTVST